MGRTLQRGEGRDCRVICSRVHERVEGKRGVEMEIESGAKDAEKDWMKKAMMMAQTPR